MMLYEVVYVPHANKQMAFTSFHSILGTDIVPTLFPSTWDQRGMFASGLVN